MTIVPVRLPLKVKNIILKEGGHKALTPTYVFLEDSQVFKSLDVKFDIVDKPKRGWIESARNPRFAVQTCSAVLREIEGK